MSAGGSPCRLRGELTEFVGRRPELAMVRQTLGDARLVTLADGSRLRPDAVICATGYGRGLEPLVGHLGVLRPDGVPFAHRGAPEHPAAPRLYFAGMWGQFSGEIRLGPIHARRIARAAARSRAQLGTAEKPARKSKGRHASLAAVMTPIGTRFPAPLSRGRKGPYPAEPVRKGMRHDA